MLADYLGLTQETVSRQMTALRRAGIIEQQGPRQIRVLDPDRLLAEAGGGASLASGYRARPASLETEFCAGFGQKGIYF
jgi:DNA-binding transcriptional ArsR family regulator